MGQAFEEFSEDGRLNWPGFEANCPAQNPGFTLTYQNLLFL